MVMKQTKVEPVHFLESLWMVQGWEPRRCEDLGAVEVAKKVGFVTWWTTQSSLMLSYLGKRENHLIGGNGLVYCCWFVSVQVLPQMTNIFVIVYCVVSTINLLGPGRTLSKKKRTIQPCQLLVDPAVLLTMLPLPSYIPPKIILL